MSDGQSDIDYGDDIDDEAQAALIQAEQTIDIREREHIARTNRLIDLARKTTDSVAENIEQINEFDLTQIESKVRLYMTTVWNILERKTITNHNGKNHGKP